MNQLNLIARFQVVFRPFMGEVLTGVISKSTADGLWLSVGFFSDIFVPPHFMMVFYPRQRSASSIVFDNFLSTALRCQDGTVFDDVSQLWVRPPALSKQRRPAVVADASHIPVRRRSGRVSTETPSSTRASTARSASASPAASSGVSPFPPAHTPCQTAPLRARRPACPSDPALHCTASHREPAPAPAPGSCASAAAAAA